MPTSKNDRALLYSLRRTLILQERLIVILEVQQKILERQEREIWAMKHARIRSRRLWPT